MKTKNQNQLTKGTVWTIVIFYALVALEFFYMASPFAAYFYSVYKPGLSFLDKYPSISWLTGFFMPHIVKDTTSFLLNASRITGVAIASLGFLIFLICASQVYYAKLFRKGMVKGGLYRYIRHPQYTAFAICSFGLLLLWPRFLVLVLFVTVLFAYYLLANVEEIECTSKFGDSYRSYLKRTYMFLPVRLSFGLSGRVSPIAKVLVITGVYLLSVATVIIIGRNIKKYSIDSLVAKYDRNEISVSIFKLSDEKMDQLLAIANNDSFICEIRDKSIAQNKKMIKYIVPSDMYISEIPMMIPDNASCHVSNDVYSSIFYKIIYCTARTRNNVPLKDGRDILYHTLFPEPLAEIWIDLKSKKVIKSFALTAATIHYKNIPEPVF